MIARMRAVVLSLFVTMAIAGAQVPEPAAALRGHPSLVHRGLHERKRLQVRR